MIIAEMEKLSTPRHKTLRYLSRLVAHYNLDKRSDNQQVLYTLRLRPRNFNQLEYIANLDRAVSPNDMKYEWGVGGSLSQLAAGTILGFPHVKKESDPDVAFVLDILLTSIAKMFDSLDDLRDVLLLRRAGVHIRIPNGVFRNLILQTYVKVLDQDLNGTEEIADKLIPSLHYYSEVVRHLWNRNRTNAMDAADPSNGIVSMNMCESFAKLLSAKKYLKDEGIDISRYNLSELADKNRKIDQRTEEFTEAAFHRQEAEGATGMKSVLLPKEMSEQHSLWGLAYSVKLAELYKSMGLQEKQDMALVITRSPGTMDTQTTDEHILLDFIEVGKENKELARFTEEQRARFLGERFGDAYINMPREEIDKLRERPSLIQALGTHVDAFYEEYHNAREKRIRLEENLDRELYEEYGHEDC